MKTLRPRFPKNSLNWCWKWNECSNIKQQIESGRENSAMNWHFYTLISHVFVVLTQSDAAASSVMQNDLGGKGRNTWMLKFKRRHSGIIKLKDHLIKCRINFTIKSPASRLDPSPVGPTCSHGTSDHWYGAWAGGQTLSCSQRSGLHHGGGVWTTAGETERWRISPCQSFNIQQVYAHSFWGEV